MRQAYNGERGSRTTAELALSMMSLYLKKDAGGFVVFRDGGLGPDEKPFHGAESVERSHGVTVFFANTYDDADLFIRGVVAVVGEGEPIDSVYSTGPIVVKGPEDTLGKGTVLGYLAVVDRLVRGFDEGWLTLASKNQEILGYSPIPENFTIRITYDGQSGEAKAGGAAA